MRQFKDITFEIFRRLGQKLNLTISDSALEKFRIYHQLLLEWGERINLYSKNDRNRLLAYHFLDSLLPVGLIPKGATLADIGSGAGFPGIPIKIVRPDLKVFFFEARKKKALFLTYVFRNLSLNEVEVINRRVEEYKGEGFHIFTIRLLGKVREVIPSFAHLLKDNSQIIFYKGSGWEKELKEGERVIKKFGLRLENFYTFHLPWLRLTRKILVFRKGE